MTIVSRAHVNRVTILALLSLLLFESFQTISPENAGGSDKLPTRDLVLLLDITEKRYEAGQYIQLIERAKVINRLPLDELDSSSASILAEIHSYIGHSYMYLKGYGLALRHYSIQNEVYNKWGRENLKMNLLGSTAVVYEVMGDLNKAFELYQSELRLRKKYNSNVEHSYVHIARVNLEWGRMSPALSYLDSAIDLASYNKNQFVLEYAYRSMAWYYSLKNDLLMASEYYERAIDVCFKAKRYSAAISNAQLLAEIRLKQEEFHEAANISQEYLKMADTLNHITDAIKLADNLFESYMGLGMYKEAVKTEVTYRMLRDSLEMVQSKNSLLLGELRQKAADEVEILKKQDEVNQQTIQFQTTLIIYTLIGLFLLVGVAIIIYRAFVINRRLSRLNQQQSDRLLQLDEAKSRFFANISHDLRTPLSLMMGSMEQVLQNGNVYLTEKAERQLKTGLTNGRRIIHLTNEINELIKLEDSQLVIHKEYVNMDDMLSLFVSMFHSMADLKGLNLSYTKPTFDEKPIAHIDFNQFEKVLFNLMTNALKHTRKGDFISLDLNRKDASTLEILLTDSGEGIPADNVPYIFERYYQAPKTTFKTQEGFGIGLALVKEIIDKHDAKISVKSEHGEGTQFAIHLRLEQVSDDQLRQPNAMKYSDQTRNLFKSLEEAPADDKPVVSVPASSAEGELKTHTILLVEDHPEVRQYIQDIIDPYYKILTAGNGKRALKVLDSKKDVDLIITDLMMPWFDGFQLLEALKEDDRLNGIPILVLSARTSEADKQKVLAQGVNDFLYKPFDTQELLTRIKNLLDRKAKWDNSKSLFINDPKTLSDIEMSLLEKVETMIIEKIADPGLSVGYLAQEIAVSERKFFRMIKKMTDSTPFEYIKEIRLQYAKKLIQDKRISTSSEAAKHIGMNNVSHFNNQFKSRFGKRPSEILEEITS